MRLNPNTLVLVMDGKKILLLRNTGDADTPKLTVEHGEEQANPDDGDQKSDRAGRHPSGTPDSGGGGSSTGESDYHEQAEERFAIHAADLLRERALRQDYDALVVVADPSTLGVLRAHYHKEVKDRLVGEIAKTLTSHPIDKIADMLSHADA